MANKLNAIYKILVLILLGFIAFCQYKQMEFNNELLDQTKKNKPFVPKKPGPFDLDFDL